MGNTNPYYMDLPIIYNTNPYKIICIILKVLMSLYIMENNSLSQWTLK